ncbi:WG repeat-containing protein [Brevibacillus sp. HB1.1]|uniref:WG repeat-containing protein n=1 Tax=Brevibacillus sp. HB1.1 TaxID=2738808 RepID=UPI001575797F|nr:WG repeat-containing protein [Brevibacillus sp. HB1.1]NTU31798.1 WG repeat-containing protein [Brevibacillus sp. HB1.1]
MNIKTKTISLVTAVVLGTSAWTSSVHAATFSQIQPYLTDYKIGFTDGNKLVTQAIYDDFELSSKDMIVTKGGKKGILDARTGKEITPAIWDNIDIPDSKNIAIVQKGSWFQYIDLKTHKLSTMKFAGAHPYYLSKEQGTAIMLLGKSSMLLNVDGKVLIPPFAGKLAMVQLVAPDQTENKEVEKTRYFVASTPKELIMYDPASSKKLFALAKAEWIPNEGGPDTAYLKVRSGGKEGLIDRYGKYVLEPKYNAIYIWINGYFQVIGPKGQGLWKDGRMLAEPIYKEVGIEHNNPDVYYTVSGDVITYHSRSKGTSHPLKKGAELLHGSYVQGQDPKTNLYGVLQVGGETVIPFAYPRAEGPPAARLLVRSDGKKVILPGWGKEVKEPDFWFDSYVTLGSYSMLSIKDGNKIGLYSENEGLVLPPVENRVIRYEEATGQVLVTEPDGKVLRYNSVGKSEETGNTMPLSDELTTMYQPGKGVMIVDRKTNQPISKLYQSVYMDSDTNLIVAMDHDWADLYTAEGKLLTTEIKVAVWKSGNDGPPLTLIRVADSVYTMGVRAGNIEMAMIKADGGQLQVVSDFVYRDADEAMVQNQKIAVTARLDGTLDVWVQEGNQLTNKLTSVKGFHRESDFDRVLIQSSTGWDVYSPQLLRLSTGDYQSMKYLPLPDRKMGVIAYQDKKTGLYGLMSLEGKVLTAAKYEAILPTNKVFSQMWSKADDQTPYVFTTKDQFGYLSQGGQELFATRFLTKKPVVSYSPITFQAFSAYSDVMRHRPLELIDFGKPYSWPAGGNSESKFFANLALYLNLPKDAGKQAVLSDLVSKGIIKVDENRSVMSDEDMFRVAYFMATGKTSQAMKTPEVMEWAQKRGIVPVREGMSYYMTMDLYTEYQHILMTELMRSLKGKKVLKPKTLTTASLSDAQQQMLTTALIVNGKPANQLSVPLPQAEWQKAIQGLVNQYNKQAAQLLAAYEAKL